MKVKVDNRWSAGSLDAKVPETAKAAYGARWIDMGDHCTQADIVPDRQGFMYDNETGVTDRGRLIDLLCQHQPERIAPTIDRDVEFHAIDKLGFQVWMRRAGGYVYVAAWIE